MKQKTTVITVLGAALAGAAIGLAAPADAAPTGTGNAQTTISNLESQGFHVVVNRLSTSPLTEANVVSVGQGPSFTHTVSGASSNDDRVFGPVTKTLVYVQVK